MSYLVPLQQWDEKDCSMVVVLNCIRLNTPQYEHIFTQELVNKLMKEYINKHPRDAFKWLKEEKKYSIRYITTNFEWAKNMMKKGKAIICRRKYNKNWWNDILDWDWTANGSKPIDIDVWRGGHFFVLITDGDIYRAWDSNTRMTYKVDLEYFYRAWVIGKEFYFVA